MNKTFVPYYLSRVLISIVFAWLVFGPGWPMIAMAVVLFGLFVLYLHSGWFQVDSSAPWFPLRRDERGRAVQRKAMIAAAAAGGLVLLVASVAARAWAAAPAALAAGVLAYFVAQFWLLATA